MENKVERLVFEDKEVEKAKAAALETLGINEDELIFNILEQPTKGIFGIGGKKAKVEVIKLKDVIEFTKEYLKETLALMGFEAKFESFYREGYINFKIYSDNNNLLIGRDGKTMSAVQFILKQVIVNQFGQYIGVTLDVGGYKHKQKKRLERLAHKVSRTVARSKKEAKLDPMNAYERRIVHNYLADDRFVYTTSEGEDPERYVVIKLKK
jgi:spoIIIJ-associated protein